MILEICVDSIEAAIAAEKAGADRIELCANLQEGGVTPSIAYINWALQNIAIPVYPIIRPRGGDFFYSDTEFAIIKKDIQQCLQLGCKGVVVGILNKFAAVDLDKMNELMDIGIEITFHRAFDRTNNMIQALEDVISIGCKRILTSGLYPNVNEGMNRLQQLVEIAGERIIIMPGSGVRSTNLEQLITTTKAKEYHSSAKKIIPTKMQKFNPNFDKQENDYTGIDENEIKKMKEIIKVYRQ